MERGCSPRTTGGSLFWASIARSAMVRTLVSCSLGRLAMFLMLKYVPCTVVIDNTDKVYDWYI